MGRHGGRERASTTTGPHNNGFSGCWEVGRLMCTPYQAKTQRQRPSIPCNCNCYIVFVTHTQQNPHTPTTERNRSAREDARQCTTCARRAHSASQQLLACATTTIHMRYSHSIKHVAQEVYRIREYDEQECVWLWARINKQANEITGQRTTEKRNFDRKRG